MTVTNRGDQDLTDCCSTTITEQTSRDLEVDSCCSVPSTSSSEALDQLEASTSPSDELALLRSSGFRLLLREGRPIERGEWSAAAGLEPEALNGMLASSRVKGRVQLDDHGRLLGIAGLTVEPSRHQLTIGDEIRWTWCALDAVGILGALEATGSIHSTDPGTGDPVDIDFVDGYPAGDATLFILGGYERGNVIEDWCPMVNFFTSRADAEAWVAEKDLVGDIVSLAGMSLTWAPLR